MQERIKQLEAHIEGGETGEVTRGDKTFMNRGVQAAKEIKKKEKDIQTDQVQYPEVQQVTTLYPQQMPLSYTA